MLWLWSRLPAIVSIITCLVFLGGIPSAEPPSRGANVLLEPSLATAETLVPQTVSLVVAVVNCARGPGGVVKPANVQVFQWVDELYPLIATASIMEPRNARFELGVGGYWLLATSPGCARSVQWLSVDGSSDLQQTLSLDTPIPLRILVRNEDKIPIPQALVLAWGQAPIAHGARTAFNGIALLEEASPDVERIVVSAPGYESAEVVPVNGGAEVILRQLGSLEVSVVDSQGDGVKGARIRIAGFAFAQPQEVLTDNRGVATIRALERGSYDVRADVDDLVSPSRLGVVLGKGQHRKLTLELSKGRFVSVQVVDGSLEYEEPVSDAEVVLVEDGLGPFPLHGRTNARGRVELGPLPFTDAVLNVRADGYVARSGVNVSRKSEQTQVVKLLRGGVLTGIVVNSEGQPVAGARLEVVGNDVFGRPIAARSGNVAVRRVFFDRAAPGALPLAPVGELGVIVGALPTPAGQIRMTPERSSWVSDDMGFFRLEDVPPGRLRIFARHPDYVAVLSAATSLAPGGEATLRVVLPLGAVLRGQVVDSRGEPIEGARVNAVAQRGSDQQTTFTDDTGQFEFSDVPRLVVVSVARPEDPHRFVIEQHVEVLPGGSESVHLVLPSVRGSCEISVTGPDGEVVDDARVSLLSLDPKVPLRQSMFVNEEGLVVMEDAAGLKVEVKVRSLRYQPFSVRLSSLPGTISVQLERGGSIVGEVTHVRGRQSLEGARVQWIQGAIRQEMLTDEMGAYRFDEVGAGQGTLLVSKKGFSSKTQVIFLSEEQLGQGRDITMPSVELLEGGVVSGVILDVRGQPVPSARVGQGLIPAFLPVGSSPEGFVQTDAQGRFLLSGLPEGKVSLSAYAVDVGRGFVDSVVVEAGQETQGIEIQLGGHHPDTEPGSLGNAAITLGERHFSTGTEVVIVHVADGSEAAAAGIQIGDIIVEVDGVGALSLLMARGQLGGPEGSDVVIGLRRGDQLFHVRLRREAVRR